MANWNQISEDLRTRGSTFDIIRKEALNKLHRYTKRNVIVYYSGWLQKNSNELQQALSINDMDMNGFMTAINGLDSTVGLDLILHTPGGEVAATEAIISYLQSKFQHIRVIVPQLAMSGGTMIACSAHEIIMGKHSSLGPVDPQIGGVPAHGIVEEFDKAHKEIQADPSKLAVWQFVLQKYPPNFVGECQKAIDWSVKIIERNLRDRMLRGKADIDSIVARIKEELCNHAVSLSHSRHLPADKCREIGLEVIYLEDDQKLQDAVLTVHHATMQTIFNTPAFKIIENHNGQAFILGTPQSHS
ncbi:MAG TPA: S49 family peptidase [Candidatus Paceibacterota bacterium]|nr:S49 family peptidase [Candidatus Paceibacterota bacterium]